MLKSIVCIAFATALFCSQGFSQSADGTSSTKDKNMFASNECIAKGGIGILVKNLYVDLKSGKNELVLGGGSRWTGKTHQAKK